MMHRTERMIVVVWHWDKADANRLSGPEDYDCWRSSASDAYFFRAACKRKQPGAVEMLAGLAERYLLPTGSALYFLHTAQPHNFNSKFAEELQTEIRPSTAQIRVRLFSGGKGPIYVNNSKFGVLGIGGDFPAHLPDKFVEPGSSQRISDFVLNDTERVLNAQHLDYLWHCYWNTPYDALLRLAQEIQYRLLHFNHTEALLPFLQSDPALWHKLLVFANRDHLADNPDLIRAFQEYRAPELGSVLSGAGDHEAATRVEALSGYVGTLLDGPAAAALSDLKHIDHIYSTLVGLTPAVSDSALDE